jgi:hypothetical protein
MHLKKRIMKNLFVILFVPFFAFSQSEWQQTNANEFGEIVRQYEQNIPKNDHYSLDTKYSIYKDYDAELPLETFNSKLICRLATAFNVSQMNYLMIQDNTANLTIDTSERQLIVQQPDTSFFHRKTLQDYAELSKMTTAIYKKALNGKTNYMLEFTKGLPYQAMEFVFSDKNTISQLVIYSSSPYYVEGDGSSSEKAKIVLDFDALKTGKSVNLNGFLNVKDCVLIEGNTITALGKYKDFEVIDLRNE